MAKGDVLMMPLKIIVLEETIPLKILVVEDNPSRRESLVLELKELLHEDYVKLDDAPARRNISSPLHEYDIIVCDVNLKEHENEREYEGVHLFADAWASSLAGRAMPEIVLYTGYGGILAAYEPFTLREDRGDLPLLIIDKSDTKVLEGARTTITDAVIRRIQKIRRRFLDSGTDLRPLSDALFLVDSYDNLVEVLNILLIVPGRGEMRAGELFPEIASNILGIQDVPSGRESEWQQIKELWQEKCVDNSRLFRFFGVFVGDLATEKRSILSVLTHYDYDPNSEAYGDEHRTFFREDEVKAFLNEKVSTLPVDVASEIQNYIKHYCYDPSAKIYRRALKEHRHEEEKLKESFSFDLIKAVNDMKRVAEGAGGQVELGSGLIQILEKLSGTNQAKARREFVIPSVFYAERDNLMNALRTLTQLTIEKAYEKDEERWVFLDLSLSVEPQTKSTTFELTLADSGCGITNIGHDLHKGEQSGRGIHYRTIYEGLYGYCQYKLQTVVDGKLVTHDLWSGRTEETEIPHDFNNQRRKGTRVTMTFRAPLYHNPRN